MVPPKHHGPHGPGMLLRKLLGPLKLLEFVEAALEFLLKTPSILFCLKQQLAFYQNNSVFLIQTILVTAILIGFPKCTFSVTF